MLSVGILDTKCILVTIEGQARPTIKCHSNLTLPGCNYELIIFWISLASLLLVTYGALLF